MWVFAPALPETYWLLAPRAPHPTKPAGYSWRVLPPEGGDGPDMDDLRDSADHLIGLVDEYCAANGIPAETFDIMGFSQGAAVTSAVALLYPARIDKAAMLSGFIPRGAESLATGRPLEGKRFFIAHGTQDQTVNVAYARQSVQFLKGAGADVILCEDEVGHKVSTECMRGLAAFFG